MQTIEQTNNGTQTPNSNASGAASALINAAVQAAAPNLLETAVRAMFTEAELQTIGLPNAITLVKESYKNAADKYKDVTDLTERQKKIQRYVAGAIVSKTTGMIESNRNHYGKLTNASWWIVECVVRPVVSTGSVALVGVGSFKLFSYFSKKKAGAVGAKASAAVGDSNPFQKSATERPVRPSRELQTA